jgi:hypothetical protein
MPAFLPYAVVVLAAAWLGLIFLPSLLNRTRGGGARLRRPATERTLRNVSTASQLVLWRGLHIPHDLSVDSARDAVLELQVHLGDGVLGEDGGIGDITCTGQSKIPLQCWYQMRARGEGDGRRTDGGRLDHVADGESLYRLVLGCASRAVGAADGLDVAAALLVAAAVVC